MTDDTTDDQGGLEHRALLSELLGLLADIDRIMAPHKRRDGAPYRVDPLPPPPLPPTGPVGPDTQPRAVPRGIDAWSSDSSASRPRLPRAQVNTPPIMAKPAEAVPPPVPNPRPEPPKVTIQPDNDAPKAPRASTEQEAVAPATARVRRATEPAECKMQRPAEKVADTTQTPPPTHRPPAPAPDQIAAQRTSATPAPLPLAPPVSPVPPDARLTQTALATPAPPPHMPVPSPPRPAPAPPAAVAMSPPQPVPVAVDPARPASGPPPVRPGTEKTQSEDNTDMQPEVIALPLPAPKKPKRRQTADGTLHLTQAESQRLSRRLQGHFLDRSLRRLT